MREKVTYQSIDVPFPEKLFITCLWLNPERFIIFPFHLLHKRVSNLASFARVAINQLRKREESSDSVLDTVLCVELSFVKKYPLKKDMWDPPVIKFTPDNYVSEFVKALGKQELYYMVVAPQLDKKKNKKLSINYNFAFPVLKSSDKIIDNLMQSSDLFVSPEAKNSGIYTIERVFGYDLENKKEIVRPAELVN